MLLHARVRGSNLCLCADVRRRDKHAVIDGEPIVTRRPLIKHAVHIDGKCRRKLTVIGQSARKRDLRRHLACREVHTCRSTGKAQLMPPRFAHRRKLFLDLLLRERGELCGGQNGGKALGLRSAAVRSSRTCPQKSE